MRIIVKDDWDISYGSVVSTFYIEEEDWAFPYKSWTDFPIGCMEGWLPVILNLLNCHRKGLMMNEQLLFMDGSYMIQINYSPDNSQLFLGFYNGFDLDEEKGELVGESLVRENTQLNVVQLAEIFLAAGNTILKTARSNNVNCSKVQKLVNSISKQLNSIKRY